MRLANVKIGITVLGLAAQLLVAACSVVQADDSQDFNTKQDFYTKKVRPLLATYCLECHSSNSKRQAGLALDSRVAMIAGGENGSAVDLQAPQRSLLIKAVMHEDGLEMPPEKKLKDDEIAILLEWIRQGAQFDSNPTEVDPQEMRRKAAAEHWAFQPLQDIEPLKADNDDWSLNDVDRFIFRRLQTEGLSPSPSVDRRTFIRRLSLDLLGLPPSPEEVQQFVDDSSPNAYDNLVERYLSSPQYGERWGRHWLDLARYADSSGFHNDLDRPWAWKYRDWVIESFNNDKPYADFVAEQIAGDEVPNANLTTLIATGFCRNGPSNDDNMGKSEAALKQYRADQLDDVISTTATVFLGVTIGCARCHDHKTDPFTMRDYYH